MTDRCGSSRFLRNLCIIFPSWLLTIYLPKNTIGRFPFLHALPLQNVLLVDFLVMTVLTGVRWYHLVVLICSYQIINNAQHHFKCFFQKKQKNPKSVCWLYLSKLASWRSSLFSIFFSYLLQNISGGQMSLTAPQALWLWSTPSKGFQVVVTGNVHRRQHFLLPQSGYLGSKRPR